MKQLKILELHHQLNNGFTIVIPFVSSSYLIGSVVKVEGIELMLSSIIDRDSSRF